MKAARADADVVSSLSYLHIFLETTLTSQTAAAVIQPHSRFTKELQNDL